MWRAVCRTCRVQAARLSLDVAASFLLAPPAAPAYPPGARLLHAPNRDVLLLSIGQVGGDGRWWWWRRVSVDAATARGNSLLPAACCLPWHALQIMDEPYTAYFRFKEEGKSDEVAMA